MQTCSQCSKPLPPDAQFCVECGKAVAALGVSLTCPQCKTSLPTDARFCTECGYNLTAAPPAPEKPATAAWSIPPAPARTQATAPASTPWLRYGGLSALGILGVLLLWKGIAGQPTTSSSSALPVRLDSTPAVPGPDLAQLADTWSVDPSDPAFVSDSREKNELILHQQGAEVSGHGPEHTPFRFWVEGSNLVGEASDPEGKSYKVTWEWVEPGQKARLSLRADGGKGDTVTLRRGPASLKVPPSPAASSVSEVILFQVDQDLNGDRTQESARVVALDHNPEPNSSSRKVLRIYGSDGRLQFQSEPFEEPFRTDLDSTAEKSEEKAGLRLLVGTSYPRIRLIFATRSGNFVDFQFNGKEYVLAEIGD